MAEEQHWPPETLVSLTAGSWGTQGRGSSKSTTKKGEKQTFASGLSSAWAGHRGRSQEPRGPRSYLFTQLGVLWEFSWVQTKLWMIGDTWPAGYHGNGQALTCPQLLLAMHPEWGGVGGVESGFPGDPGQGSHGIEGTTLVGFWVLGIERGGMSCHRPA